ncbi:MAG: HNH endonuclease [Actinomycetota bacterium]|jgi:5-methylcytosine-specific restriction endonuclease McrA|nr:HNH endonuclease [Actinomycetota bacterium]
MELRPDPGVAGGRHQPAADVDGIGAVGSTGSPPGGTPTTRALVLNATYEPLGVVSSRRAVLLVLDTKAELVHVTDRVYHSVRMSLPEPSVVRLVRYVAVPRQQRVAVNRRTVFARDGARCQYCGAVAENIDHVVPRSRGGAHAWENVVAACRRCNSRKEDRLPAEAGMVLRRQPEAPRHRVQLLAQCGPARDDWRTYLGLPPVEPFLDARSA